MRRGLLLLALVPLLGAQAGKVTYETKGADGSRFVLSNFDPNVRLRFAQRRVEFEGTGNPLRIESFSPQGDVVFTGRRATGAMISGPTSVIEAVDLSGDAVFLRTTPANDPVKGTSRLTTDRLTYAGNESEGTLTLPVAFSLVDKSEGVRQVDRQVNGQTTRVPETFTQDTTMSGTRGTIIFDPRSTTPQEQRLRKGTIEGPIKMTLRRSALRQGDSDPTRTNLDATADRLEFDFTTNDRTATLTGNVVIDGDSEAVIGKVNAQRAILKLNENLEVTEVIVTGAPITTRFRERPTGGGR